MKKIIFILAVISGLGYMPKATAQGTKHIIPGVSVRKFNMGRNGKYLTVEMNVDLTELKVDANRAVLLTPRLINGEDSLDLQTIGIYGRKRYYYYIRNRIGDIPDENGMAYRASEKPDSVPYNAPVIYEEWMDGATIKLHRSDYGCCHDIIAEHDGMLGRYNEAFFPELVFIRPEVEAVKCRSLSGSAFIDFPVNQTAIRPEYRRNSLELDKIHATIDSVRDDKDIFIVSVWLKGYASPESPYSHNRNLAMKRTEALKEHIRQLYSFADDIIMAEHEAEDWDGLRRYVERSNINHHDEILDIIGSNVEPDAREAKIKRAYPQEYRFLLQHCYPTLRRTDYRIDYNIRGYSDAEEIRRIMVERPQKLSLNEFYLVAGIYEIGTEEFTDVFKTAVRMFPNDETANLNAANAAIRRDNFDDARKYLRKAGDSAEAFYARGALAIREKNYELARVHLNRAKDLGLVQAELVLTELAKREE